MPKNPPKIFRDVHGGGELLRERKTKEKIYLRTSDRT